MSFNKALGAVFAAACLAFGAHSQIISSGIGEIDPWGMGYLEPDEEPLPPNMWKASNASDLVPLMRKVRTRSLTPAERALLRRAVLSPALKPNGKEADDVMAERARIMFELGEAKAAADLMTRLTKAPPGLDPEQVSADLQLALGNEATACRPVQYGALKEGPYWARLRAACAALQNNIAGAELAVELAASQGVNDPWLFSAVFAGLGEAGEPPNARFDSGISLALSTKANLNAPVNAVAVSGRPDLAAAMAGRASLPPELRVQGANVAAQAGLISASDHRAIYQILISQPDFSPITSNGAALQRATNVDATIASQARAYADALRSSSGSAARFTATSRLLRNDIARLRKGPDTAEYAALFARASIAAGDLGGAKLWTAASHYEVVKEVEQSITAEVESVPPATDGDAAETDFLAAEAIAEEQEPEIVIIAADPFDVAIADAMIVLAGGIDSPAAVKAVAQRLVKVSATPEQKQTAARLLTLWSGLDLTVPVPARRLMSRAGELEKSRISSSKVYAVKAAADADAAGEAILSLLGYTKGDPTQIRASDMIVFLEALSKLDAREEARILALEAAGYWKETPTGPAK